VKKHIHVPDAGCRQTMFFTSLPVPGLAEAGRDPQRRVVIRFSY
jgi:hypothetical protein